MHIFTEMNIQTKVNYSSEYTKQKYVYIYLKLIIKYILMFTVSKVNINYIL